MSRTLTLLLAQFPGAIQVPLAAATVAMGVAYQSAQNQISAGVFPVPTFKLGRLRMVRLDDLADYLDHLAAPPPTAPILGAPLKKERLQARALGLTTKALRAQQAGV